MSSQSLPILGVSVNGEYIVDLRLSCQLSIERQITVLFKECLMIMEQLHEEHFEAMDKMYSALPPDYKTYVDLADHFTDEKRERIRKAILQRGNDCVRNVRLELSKYDLSFHDTQNTTT